MVFNDSDCSRNTIIHFRNRIRTILLGGYSYLGLDKHPYVQEATIKAIQHYGTGTPGARLLAGILDVHKSLEQKLANFLSTESAVNFFERLYGKCVNYCKYCRER